MPYVWFSALISEWGIAADITDERGEVRLGGASGKWAFWLLAVAHGLLYAYEPNKISLIFPIVKK